MKQWALLGIDAVDKGSHKAAWAILEGLTATGMLPYEAELDRLVGERLAGGYPE